MTRGEEIPKLDVAGSIPVDLRQRLAELRALDLRGPTPEGLQQADADGGSAPAA